MGEVKELRDAMVASGAKKIKSNVTREDVDIIERDLDRQVLKNSKDHMHSIQNASNLYCESKSKIKVKK